MNGRPLDWPGVIRLGIVQTAIGAMFALTSRTLNRVMVVEYALPAALPAGLIAWNYVVQLTRARWGHGSDVGGRRTPWIIGGMGVMALGAMAAVDAVTMTASNPVAGVLVAIVAYALIGGGVGAAGTSLLALLATRVAPERRPAAAAIAWIMMIAGFILYAAVTGALLEPFSPQRLAIVASVICGVCLAAAVLAVRNAEPEDAPQPSSAETIRKPTFREALADIWAEPLARRFTIFVFVSMLAYSLQELILEPFAGLVFGLSPAQSAKLSGFEQGGALLGMILVGALGGRMGRGKAAWMRAWTVAGCAGSAVALGGLAFACVSRGAWALPPTVFALGLANGVFAVSAIGSMMGLAGAGCTAQAGARMGLWGGAQAAAFAIGGFLGATGVQVLRAVLRVDTTAFLVAFIFEALVFLLAAILAARLQNPSPESDPPAPALTTIEFEGAR